MCDCGIWWSFAVLAVITVHTETKQEFSQTSIFFRAKCHGDFEKYIEAFFSDYYTVF